MHRMFEQLRICIRYIYIYTYIFLFMLCLSCFVVGVKGVSFCQLSNNQCSSLVKHFGRKLQSHKIEISRLKPLCEALFQLKLRGPTPMPTPPKEIHKLLLRDVFKRSRWFKQPVNKALFAEWLALGEGSWAPSIRT